MIAQVATLHIK